MNLEKLTVVQLRAELKKRGLSIQGLKICFDFFNFLKDSRSNL